MIHGTGMIGSAQELDQLDPQSAHWPLDVLLCIEHVQWPWTALYQTISHI